MERAVLALLPGASTGSRAQGINETFGNKTLQFSQNILQLKCKRTMREHVKPKRMHNDSRNE
ncbi:MAG: hypothetical protein XD36_1072 [Halomonas sp. 54_146]|nr:MAG: hypothetical protein XD36_1072 [Halomonas sp. 54_146]